VIDCADYNYTAKGRGIQKN